MEIRIHEHRKEKAAVPSTSAEQYKLRKLWKQERIELEKRETDIEIVRAKCMCTISMRDVVAPCCREGFEHCDGGKRMDCHTSSCGPVEFKDGFVLKLRHWVVGPTSTPTLLLASPYKPRNIGTSQELSQIQQSNKRLLGAPGIATSSKKLLGAPGLTTRSKDATRNRRVEVLCMYVAGMDMCVCTPFGVAHGQS